MVSRIVLKVKLFINLFFFKIMLKSNSIEEIGPSNLGTKFKLLDIIFESIFKINGKNFFASKISKIFNFQ